MFTFKHFFLLNFHCLTYSALGHQVKTKANLRKHAADRGLHKVGGGDDHLRDEEQPGTLLSFSVKLVIIWLKSNLSLKKSSCFSLTLAMNFVFVWIVLQGIVQGDSTVFKKILPQYSPGQNCIVVPLPNKIYKEIYD